MRPGPATDRFEELLGLVVDGDPSRQDIAELTRLAEGDPDRARELCAQFETAELIALAEDELRDAELFTSVVRDRLTDTGFVEQVRSRTTGRPLLRWVPWGMAAAATVALALTSPWQARAVAELVEVEGQVRWTDASGRIENTLAPGRALASGTIESLAADGWATLKFPDQSVVTISGASSLTIAAPGASNGTSEIAGTKALAAKKKAWFLRRGTLAATVPDGPDRAGVTMATPSAAMEAAGRFRVTADASGTRVSVDLGRMRLERLSDGRIVDVPAAHLSSASTLGGEALSVVERGAPVPEWQASLKNDATYGDYVDYLTEFRESLVADIVAGRVARADARRMLGDFAASLRDPAGLRASLKGKVAGPVYVVSLAPARTSMVPVVLTEEARFLVRGRVSQPVGLIVGLGSGPVGGAPRTRAMAPEVRVDGEFEIALAAGDFNGRGQGVVGTELFTWFAFTKGVDAGLEITSVELQTKDRKGVRQ